jgi:hypothetical protein
LKTAPAPTGLSGENRPCLSVPGSAADRPLSQAWISDALLEDTRRVWSKIYGRVISAEEAVEILVNVKRFAELLVEIKRERCDP